MRKKRKIAICILSFLMLFSILIGGLFPPKVALAQTSVPAQGVLDVENANVAMQTHTSKDGTKAYTGVTVGNGGESAYSGKFDGVFTGALEIEYKFPGLSELSDNGDSMGSFTFRVTSVNNPKQWFDVFIESRFSGDELTKDYFALENAIYGDYSAQDRENYNYYAANADGWSPGPKATITSRSGLVAPKFNTNNSSDTEKLCFDISAGGYFSIGYYTGADSSQKKKIVAFDNSFQLNITQPFDYSAGYTISFSSEIVTKGKSYYVGAITDGQKATPTKAKSTDICFLGINGISLSEDVDVTVENDVEKSYIFNGRALSQTQRNVVELNGDETIYRYMNSSLYNDTATGNSFSFISKTPVATGTTDSLGDYSVVAEDITFLYSVGETKDGYDFANVLINEDHATVNYIDKKIYVANKYDGVMVKSDSAYSGQFEGAFFGSTELEYKFPGNSKVAHKNTNRNGKGDGLGDFYFYVQSLANAEHWFKISIRTMQTSDGTYDASKTTMMAMYPYINPYKNGQVYVAYKYSGGYKSGIYSYPEDLDKIENEAKGRYSLSPHFNSDLNDAPGDFTERLYFDVDENGYMSVYYDMRGVGAYESNFTFENVGKYGFSSGQARPLINFSNSTAAFDVSKGYTVSFGSDFDLDRDYVDGNGNEINLNHSDYQYIDGGTDIIFVSVNGLTFDKEQIAYVCDESFSFDGQEISNGDNVHITQENINEPILVSTKVYTDTDFIQEKTTSVVWRYTDLVNGKLQVSGTNFGGRFDFELNVTYDSGLSYMVNYLINGNSTSISYPIEQCSVSLDSAECAGKHFVGWKIDSLGAGLYPAGYEYVITPNDKLTAVFVDFSVLTGASIRLEAPYGIRFFTQVLSADYNTLTYYLGTQNFNFGMLMLPTDVFEEAFTHVDYQKEGFIDFKELLLITEESEQLKGIYQSNYKYYTGMYIDMPNEYIARSFSARAYMSVNYADGTKGYIYSNFDEENNSRSAYNVAKACLAANEQGGVLNDYIVYTANLEISDTSQTEWSFDTEIYSVCLNGVWISEEGAEVQIGANCYTITYQFDKETNKLTLSYSS